jgi:fatty acid desaturase
MLISPRVAVEALALWLAARATTFHAITMFREISDHAGLSPGTLLGFSRNTTARGVLNALFHPHHNGLHLVHHLNPGMPFHALPAAHQLLLAWPEYAAAAHCGSYAAVVRSWVRKQAGASIFEKKAAKKLLRLWATGVETGTV